MRVVRVTVDGQEVWSGGVGRGGAGGGRRHWCRWQRGGPREGGGSRGLSGPGVPGWRGGTCRVGAGVLVLDPGSGVGTGRGEPWGSCRAAVGGRGSGSPRARAVVLLGAGCGRFAGGPRARWGASPFPGVQFGRAVVIRRAGGAAGASRRGAVSVAGAAASCRGARGGARCPCLEGGVLTCIDGASAEVAALATRVGRGGWGVAPLVQRGWLAFDRGCARWKNGRGLLRGLRVCIPAAAEGSGKSF
jgi:hypothetical protein